MKEVKSKHTLWICLLKHTVEPHREYRMSKP